MMFSKKTEDQPAAAAPEADEPEAVAATAPAAVAPPQAAPVLPARRTVVRPEVVRRAPDYPGAEAEPSRGGYSEGKKLIVGRDIALNGTISACEKLVVEGRVEANISDCREIEVAESGTFNGEAEIDVAEISGNFEGVLTAHELLLVRSTGRVTGTIRFGRLEVERGGEIDGDVHVLDAGDQEDGADA